MEAILLGTTDRTIPIWIPDPASTTGGGKTGLVAATLSVKYTRYETDNDVVTTDVTGSLNDLASLTAAHNDWGVFEVGNGEYRLDLADAVFAAGAWYATVRVYITSGTAAITTKAFQLVAFNPLDGVRLGLTALPNANADAAGGLPISDAGGLDLDAILADTNEVQVSLAAGGLIESMVDDLQSEVDGIQADTEDIQSRLPAALGSGGNMKSILADGVAHGGSTATFRLGTTSDTTPAFYVTNADGTAVMFESTGGGPAPATLYANPCGFAMRGAGTGIGGVGMITYGTGGVVGAGAVGWFAAADGEDGTGVAGFFTGTQTYCNFGDDSHGTGMILNGGIGTGVGLKLVGGTVAGEALLVDGPITASNTSNHVNLGSAERGRIADAIWDEEDGVDGLTLREFVRLESAVLAGKLSGATGGAGTESFRNVTDTKVRVASVVDAFGNRTLITLDLT